MKKNSIIIGALALIFSIYSIYALVTIYGINIYLISYNIGKIFINSYWIVGILAIIGWCGFGIFLKKDIADRKAKKLEQKEQEKNVETDSSAIVQAAAKEEAVEEIKETTENEEVTEIEETTENEEVTEIEETTENEEVTEIEETTEIGEVTEIEEATECEKVIQTKKKVCKKCGIELKEAQKFCMKCGTKAE